MSGLKSLAQELVKKGRDGDTMLAHINPYEAEILKALGGSGTTNPHTGLPEYRLSWRSFSPQNIVNTVVSTVSSVGSSIFKGISSLGNAVVKTLQGVGTAIEKTLSKVSSTVKAIIKDPLPFIAMYAGAAIGIPPFVTSAAITAARGGDISDMVKSAAVSYAVSYVAQNVDLGLGPDAVSEFGENYQAPQTFTDITKQIGLSVGESTTQTIGNMASSALNNSVIMGVTAGLTGKDVGAAMTAGALSGSLSAGTVSLTNELGLQKDWGLSDKTMNLINKTISTGLAGAITGKDPTQIITNFIADAVVNTAGSALATEAKSAYKEYADYFSALKPKQEAYDADLKDWQNQQTATQKEIDAFNAQRTTFMDGWNKNMQPILNKQNEFTNAYNDAKAEYDKQMAIYNNTALDIDTRNAAAIQASGQASLANSYAQSFDRYTQLPKNKPIFDSYTKQNEELTAKATELNGKVALLTDYNTGAPSASNKEGSPAWQLYQSSQDIQKTTDAANAAATKFEDLQTKYSTQIATSVSRDILNDAILKGDVTPIDNPQGKPGLIYLSNGSVIDSQSKQFLTLDGKQQFVGIDNPVSDNVLAGIVTTPDGKVTYAGYESRAVKPEDIATVEKIAKGELSQNLNYDATGDGKVDAKDVLALKNIVAGADYDPTKTANIANAFGMVDETSAAGWSLTPEGNWVSPEGNVLDINGNIITGKEQEYEVQPWENLSKSGDTGNMAGWSFKNNVWTDPSGNAFDLYGNYVGEKKATTQAFKGTTGNIWGATGSQIATTKAATEAAAKAKADTKGNFKINSTKEQLAAGIAALTPELETSSQGITQGVMQQQAPAPIPVVESTGTFDLGQPFNVGYFGDVARRRQENLTQKDDGTVKIASGGPIGLMGLLHRRG